MDSPILIPILIVVAIVLGLMVPYINTALLKELFTPSEQFKEKLRIIGRSRVIWLSMALLFPIVWFLVYWLLNIINSPY